MEKPQNAIVANTYCWMCTQSTERKWEKCEKKIPLKEQMRECMIIDHVLGKEKAHILCDTFEDKMYFTRYMYVFYLIMYVYK